MPVIGLISALCVIVFVVSKWRQVPLALLLGILIIIFTNSIDISTSCLLTKKVIFNPKTQERVLTVIFIVMLSTLMYKTSLMDRLLISLKSLLKSIYILIMLLPAIIGLLPVPGGTLLSAPFTDKLGDKINLNPGHKSSVNIFFRHTSIYFNPLSPLIIVVQDLSKLRFDSIVIFHIVPIMLTLLICLLIFRRFWPKKVGLSPGYNKREVEGKGKEDNDISEEEGEVLPVIKAVRDFVIASLPLAITLILAIAFGVNFVLALAVAVFIVIMIDTLYQREFSYSRVVFLFKGALDWKLGLTVLIIFIFGEFIKSSGVINILAYFVSHRDIPLMPLLLITSVIIGFATGQVLVGAAIVYPIFTPWIGDIVFLSIILKGLMFGYVLSPIHLCLIVSNEYFKVSFKDAYPLLIAFEAILLALSIGFAYFLISFNVFR